MIKPSELKKDKQFSGRINTEVFEKLQKMGYSIQKIIDEFADKHVKIEVK